MILSVSQDEQQERGDPPGGDGVKRKDGTPLPQQNPSFSLQFNTHLPSASPCQAQPSEMDKYQASSERGKQTPRLFLCRSGLLSLSLCHEVMEDGATGSAVGARAGSREAVACELDLGKEEEELVRWTKTDRQGVPSRGNSKARGP